jgi:hypothetical protein
MSQAQTDIRTRLRSAAESIDLPEQAEDSEISSSISSFDAPPEAVFAANLRSLRNIALEAEQCSDEELANFGNELILLIAGLRARAQNNASDYPAKEDDCREKCEALVERCRQFDPENGHLPLDCFMVYADCLFRCERNSRTQGA